MAEKKPSEKHVINLKIEPLRRGGGRGGRGRGTKGGPRLKGDCTYELESTERGDLSEQMVGYLAQEKYPSFLAKRRAGGYRVSGVLSVLDGSRRKVRALPVLDVDGEKRGRRIACLDRL